MTLQETLKALEEDENFEGAVIDSNKRRLLIAVVWYDGPENKEAVTTLSGMGFERNERGEYRKKWPVQFEGKSSLEDFVRLIGPQ